MNKFHSLKFSHLDKRNRFESQIRKDSQHCVEADVRRAQCRNH